jgi:hypothetical protein
MQREVCPTSTSQVTDLNQLGIDLKERFRAKSEKLRMKPAVPLGRTGVCLDAHDLSQNPAKYIIDLSLVEAPPLPPTEGAGAPEPKDPMKEMEDYLDELLG